MSPGDDQERRQADGASHEADEDASARARSKSGSGRSKRSARHTSRNARPESVEEALARALVHGRNAVAEGLLAGRSLLDAASIGLTGRAASGDAQGARTGEAGRALARAAEALDGLSERVRVESPDSGHSLVQALLEALDVEIARWESKARQDQDARAVLRAFLGLRELLWELGMRPAGQAGESAPSGAPPKPPTRSKKRKRATRDTSGKSKASFGAKTESAPPARRKRVQRVEVER